ncbi:MAG TPA: PfkB family carbohydrate kinase [Solirubrobacteraceae bacterium]|nr:PfkB family carbohydrate kinase [Solirubrobacteraceae bacterium]
MGTITTDTQVGLSATRRLVGGSGTHFALAARFLAPVELISVVECDFGLDDFTVLAQQGLQTRRICRRICRLDGPQSCVYSALAYLATLRRVALASLPDASGVVYVSGLPMADQRLLAEHSRSTDIFALDLKSDWSARDRADLASVLDRVDVVFLDGAQARLLAGATQFVGAGRYIQSLGANIVVLRLGEYGACVFADSLLLKVPALPLLKVPDTSGAGASFAGGFLGALAALGGTINHSALYSAMLCGTVMASFTVEATSAERSLTLTYDALADRYDELVRVVSL